MKGCPLCAECDEALRRAVAVLERRRDLSLPLDLAPVERLKAERAEHRDRCPAWVQAVAA